VVQALTDLRAGFSAAFLGNQDYFALDFDLSLLLFKKAGHLSFCATILFQWAPKYFTGDEAEVIGFAPVRNSAQLRSIVLRHRRGLYLFDQCAIEGQGRCGPGAGDDVVALGSLPGLRKLWPGYWAPPLKEFPDDPAASSLGRRSMPPRRKFRRAFTRVLMATG